ncbi:MAG: hypothetical protein GY785_04940 [Gammaproteobacteria bacterium]|nr:hypothetical protein [Gammaproteobacteria bacterium]
MNRIKHAAWVLLLLLAGQVLAYDNKEQMIDDKLTILDNAGFTTKVEMLKRLQWSGLSDVRLFDQIAELPASKYQRSMNNDERGLAAHSLRALGFSGNPKYQDLLKDIKAKASSNTLKRHARSGLADLERHQRWNELLAQSDFSVNGKSYEVATYMKMLSINDFSVQKLAARATFHERRLDSDLLKMIADNLKASYLRDELDGEAQDTMAWFCKALGQNAIVQYHELLSEVAANSPHSKIKKYARKYVN